MNFKQRYLKLLKYTLTDYHRFQQGEYRPVIEEFDVESLGLPLPLHSLFKEYLKFSKLKNYSICKKQSGNPEVREQGLDFPSYAETMIGIKRLDNIEYCIKEIVKNEIPGDVIETGV